MLFRRRALAAHHLAYRGVITRLLCGRQPNNRSRRNDENCNIQNEERKVGWVKKKVALVFGYVGKNYHGLQMIDPSINTIEREIESALFSLGCILPTNKQNLDKIGWSRSSRTDKGVHAARVVVSAKLLLAPEWLRPPSSSTSVGAETGEARRFPDLVDELNEQLPPEVRAFSCTRVNKGFQARDSCHWREYEYLIPSHHLLLPSTSGSSHTRWKEEAQSIAVFANRLNEAFSLMEGSKSMHNFHRKKDSKHEVRRKLELEQRAKAKTGDSHTDVKSAKHQPVIGVDLPWDPDADDGYVSLQSDDCGTEEEKLFRFMYKDWQPRVVRESTNGSLYMARAFTEHDSEIDQSSEHPKSNRDAEGEMVTIRLRGQGFLLNQIRLMISAAVLYARGVLPLDALRLSLDSPYQFTFPLAPAEGLLLVDSGYSRNVSGQNYSLHPHHKEEQCSGDEELLSLMTGHEYTISEEFKKRCIHPEVLRDWTANGSCDLSTRWFSLCEQYHVTPQLHSRLKTLLSDYHDYTSPRRQIKFDIYLRRVESSREKYLNSLQHLHECQAAADLFAKKSVRKSQPSRNEELKILTRRVKAAHFEFPHKMFLPNGSSAALITKFQVLPSGPIISRALSALAFAVAEGTAPVFVDAGKVVAYVDETEGSIWTWAERPTSPHIT